MDDFSALKFAHNDAKIASLCVEYINNPYRTEVLGVIADYLEDHYPASAEFYLSRCLYDLHVAVPGLSRSHWLPKTERFRFAVGDLESLRLHSYNRALRALNLSWADTQLPLMALLLGARYAFRHATAYCGNRQLKPALTQLTTGRMTDVTHFKVLQFLAFLELYNAELIKYGYREMCELIDARSALQHWSLERREASLFTLLGYSSFIPQHNWFNTVIRACCLAAGYTSVNNVMGRVTAAWLRAVVDTVTAVAQLWSDRMQRV